MGDRGLCPVSATCDPRGLPNVDASMATYDFIVSGVNPEMALQGAPRTLKPGGRPSSSFRRCCAKSLSVTAGPFHSR